MREIITLMDAFMKSMTAIERHDFEQLPDREKSVRFAQWLDMRQAEKKSNVSSFMGAIIIAIIVLLLKVIFD